MSNFFGFRTVLRLYLDGIFMFFQCFITYFTYHSLLNIAIACFLIQFVEDLML